MSKKNQDFRSLYERYYPDVVAWLCRRGVDKELARDLAQDVFGRVFRGLDELRGSPWPWIQVITKRTLLNRRRYEHAKGRADETPVDEVPEPRAGRPGPGSPAVHSPEEILQSKERLARLNQVVSGLPDRARQVFLLRFRDGLKNRQIADLLGISADTVKTHLRKARDRVRAAFPDGEFEEHQDEH